MPQSFDSPSFQDAITAAFNPMRFQGGKLTIYSGNTLHKKDAKGYDLRPGDNVSGIEIILPLNGLHTISGSASGKNGILLGAGSIDLTDTVDDSISFHTEIQQDGEFAFFGIPEGSYNLKLSHGLTLENPPPDNVPVEDMASLNPQLFKPTHAFAELTQPIVVGTDDINNLTLTPTETKLPDVPAPDSQGQPVPDTPPPAPNE